jgi:TM2 domain-containing membrane protein YozV
MDSNIYETLISLLGCVIGFAIIGGVIALLIFLINKSKQEIQRSEAAVNQIISHLPQDEQMIFFMQYNNVKKNPTSAVLWALFLGGVGAHKFYMGETGLGILYLLFCWTYIPGIIAFIELFTLSGKVAKYNEQKATELSMMIGR